MNRLVLCTSALVVVFAMETLAQSPKPVPVYPGATLVTEKEEGVEPVCCDFTTTDPLEKVVSFYERQLKTKAMDAKRLTAEYPVLKSQLEAIVQQMPAGTKLRAFVLDVVTVQGQKAPVLFELLGTAQGVFFSVGEEALTGNDAQFAKQWREKTGKLTADESMQKVADQRQADEDKEQKERDARREKEEPAYRATMVADLAKVLKQNKVDLAAGLQCEDVQRQEGESSVAYAFYFTSPDNFKKVVDFYTARFKTTSTDNLEGNESTWSKHDSAYSWKTAEFEFGTDLRFEVREVSLSKNGPKTTYVTVRASSADCVNAMRKIQQEYESRW